MIMKFIQENKLSIIIYITSLVLYFLGLFFCNYNIALLSIIIVFLFNIIDSFINKKEGYLYYIFFHLFLFLFILSRPIISMLKKENWWYFSSYSINVVLFVLLITFISLNFGYCISKKTNTFSDNKLSIQHMEKLKKIFFVISFITISMSLIQGIIKYLHFRNNYVSIYTGEIANVPIIISILASLAIFFLTFYLSLLPSKKYTLVILLYYLISGIPEFLIGGRNSLMIKALFCFIYFILRNYMNSKEKWISKKEKLLIIISIPILMIGLGVMNYTRSDESIPSMSPIGITVDFLYKQGTTFDTICQTIEYRSQLRDDNYINYTFGEPIDFILHNSFSNYFFNTIDLGDGNNINNGTISNNLAHRISYLVLGDSYLSGHGRGTSYLSELYLDFGYLGIIVFNILLGLFFSKIDFIFNCGTVSRYILLNILMYLYLIPRLATFSLFSFTLNYYFWISNILIFMIIKLINNNWGNLKNV